MLIVISPAKNLDFKNPAPVSDFTIPDLTDKSAELIQTLRKLKPGQISEIMGISPAMGELNFQRFHKWHLPFTPQNAKQAIFAFNGMVYLGLDAKTLRPVDLEFLQKNLRILSGLYGVLRPLDLMQPYRVEMGSEIKHRKSKNICEFWRPVITSKIRELLEQSENKLLLNLASNEYFKSIDTRKLKADIVSPEFYEEKNGVLKNIVVYTKKARGLMVRFIVENQITNPSNLQAFDYEGYSFSNNYSKPGKPVFTRISL
jgi:hypothetical protein